MNDSNNKRRIETIPLTESELKEAKLPLNAKNGIQCPPDPYGNIAEIACDPGYVQCGVIVGYVDNVMTIIGIRCRPDESSNDNPGSPKYCPENEKI